MDVFKISQQVEIIDNHIAHTNELRLSIQADVGSFGTLHSQYTRYVQNLGHAENPTISVQQPLEIEPKQKSEKDMYEEQLKAKSINLNSSMCTYINKLNELLNLIGSAQSYVFDKLLVQWKREQQMISIGYKISTSLNVLQTWCEKLYDLIWLTRSYIKEAHHFRASLSHFNGYFELQQSKEIINVLLNMTSQFLSSLVASTFIITTQPPQVLKTNTRFSAEVCLLIGEKLNFQITSPLVMVSIVNENQANQIISRNKPDHEFCGEILNCLGNMEYQNSLRQFTVNFKNLQLKKIKRTEKKGTDSVTDEKFSILFTSKFFIGNELQFEVWSLSLPVVVIVHGNQEPHAWATVTWDNAFAESGRILFNVPDKVPWRNVAVALSKKFSSVTGRELSEDSLTFLAEKVLRTQNVDFNNMVLSWTHFCKVTLQHRNFTFWEWFYAVMKLTKDHLRGPWTDGAIMGFIRKSEAEEMLTRYITGTFLLRFSDSELGGLTVAWTASNFDVYSLHPFSAKDLTIRSLADRLMDLSYLTWLYPCIDKTQAFHKYCTPPPNIGTHFSNSGYVKPLLVTHVPGWGEPGSSGQRMSSYSSTPQSHQCYANSPESFNMRRTSSVQSESVHTMMVYGNNYSDINLPPKINYGNDGSSSMDEVFFD